MARYELNISGVRSNRSANCASTTAPRTYTLLLPPGTLLLMPLITSQPLPLVLCCL